MKKPLRLLHLEDDRDYSDLVRSMLSEAGFDLQLVLTQDRLEFETALGQRSFDVILADFRLPAYDGLQALEAARRIAPETPFLLVSGTIGEQAAIESLQAGATDYVLKHWPERLAPAVQRAVKEAQERRQRRQVETELARREKYFRALTENAQDILTILDEQGRFIHNSPSIKRLLGYAPEELVGTSAFELIHPDDRARVKGGLEYGIWNPEQNVTLECRIRRSDGTWRWLEAVGQSRLNDPETAGVVVNSRDITDRKCAEAELRESEKQYRLVFHGNPTPMWIFDLETLRFLEVNESAMAHYGYSRDEFLAMDLKAIQPLESVPELLESVERLRQDHAPGGPGYAGAWRHRKKDGSLMDVEVRWSQIAFRGREAALTMLNDISERIRIEQRDAALSELGQKLSATTSPAEAAGIIKAVADDLFRWDVFTLDLYSAEQGLISPVLNVDTDREGHRVEISAAEGTRAPSGMARRVIERGAELLLRQEPLAIPADAIPIGDTARPSASLMLVPIRNRTKVIGVLSIQSYELRAYTQADLTTLQMLADHCGGALERMRAEQELRDSEQRFRDLFQGSPDAVFVEDFRGRVLDVNPAACRLHKMTREELVGISVIDLVPGDQLEQVDRDFTALIEGRLHQIEGASLTKDGQAVPVEVRASRVNYAGQPAVLLHVRDITDRKLAEAALRSSELLFHSVWENSVDGMRLTDDQGTIVAVNEAFCKLVGMPREQLEGKPLTVTFAESDSSEQVLMEYRRRFALRLVEEEKERELKLRNGQALTLAATNSFVELRGQSPLLLSQFRDLTERKRLEEQLRQSQKMDAIGQLAGGVAHDFNNILTVIHGHASLLVGAGRLTGMEAKSAQQIVQAAERAAGLTRQLLAFGRRQVMQPRQLDVNEVVANLTKMLGRILGEDIALQLQYHPEPAPVHADAGMLEQVLLNLAINSRDAMPKGGVLLIKVGMAAVESRSGGEEAGPRNGRFVCLSVEDTGCGIPPANLRRIFEPFFTTKEVGKGTGLGLATVYGIVKQHRGWVDVESEVGKGSTFRVYLPLLARAEEQVTSGQVEQRVRGGNETILVVEDEAPVRELVCNLLAAQGYRVLQAGSGVEALEVWRTRQADIRLVLTDLVMPDHLSGRDLAEKLWHERPGLKVIFSSGYSADVMGKDFVPGREFNFLQKPYQPKQLAVAVRDCLDARN